MIESISIGGVATFGEPDERFYDLAPINYVYGANGSGKTSVSRVLALPGEYSNCSLSWRGGREMQTIVYNRDFISRNLDPSTRLKGVFTLGEDSKDVQDAIAAANLERDRFYSEADRLSVALNGNADIPGKKAERDQISEQFSQVCWKQKLKHETWCGQAFDGHKRSKARFMDQVLRAGQTPAPGAGVLNELKARSRSVFGAAAIMEPIHNKPDGESLVETEECPLLRKTIIGQQDVDIAAIISKLGNSDWVGQGVVYSKMSDGTCPFCQQATPTQLAADLDEYFNETFTTDIAKVIELSANYISDAGMFSDQVVSVVLQPGQFIDPTSLQALKAEFDGLIAANVELLRRKRDQPSTVVILMPLGDVVSRIGAIIANANQNAGAHNAIVANIAAERRKLVNDIWEYIRTVELPDQIRAFTIQMNNVSAAIASIEGIITENQRKAAAKTAQIDELEKTISSIKPTIAAINSLLSRFGFAGFHLAAAEDSIHYKLVREDGADARDTLSEGERTFLTFLYFYHLIHGGTSPEGMTENRVIVLDDPVCSLDSEVMFIISSLVRSLIEQVRSGTAAIKQILILTHNIHFHKEVTFNPNRQGRSSNEETFWVIRKQGGSSSITKHEKNPIRSGYEILWADIANPSRSVDTIQNVLRTILEYYFTILAQVPQSWLDNRRSLFFLLSRVWFTFVF